MSASAPLQTQGAKSQALSSSTPTGLLLQRKCACGSPISSLTGDCAECSSKKLIQTKLTIGASNDPLEQEADRIADQVMAAPAHPAVSDSPPHILRFAGQTIGQSDTAPASVDRVLASPGTPLAPTLRQDMEERFGQDFSRVRVHSGAAAEQSAHDVNAHAYTAGPNIVFGAGSFAPGIHEGRRLIAHELTHVVQQTMGRVSVMRSSERHGNGYVQERGNISSQMPGSIVYNASPKSIMRTLDPCLDKCEKEFNRCLKYGNFPPACIGARSVCLRGCPHSPEPEGKHACVIKEQIPIIKQPVVVFDDLVFMQTDVDVEWKSDDKCDCACGEYRQYVKGHILKNDVRFDIGLCDGAKLEETTWHEDGDSATGLCSGHRDKAMISMNDLFDRPDRESGCHYLGKDEPRVPGRPGDKIDVDLKFKGQTYDKCRGTFGEIHEWAFTYKGPLGGWP